LSFFSISRLVISSDSGVTVSCARRRGVEQVHLRQLGVGQFGEQRLLALLGHSGSTGTSSSGRLDDRAGGELLDGLTLLLHDHVLALARGPFADAQVFLGLPLSRRVVRARLSMRGRPALGHA
jgi:hypothetical protein